jgi:hypothetical protein
MPVRSRSRASSSPAGTRRSWICRRAVRPVRRRSRRRSRRRRAAPRAGLGRHGRTSRSRQAAGWARPRAARPAAALVRRRQRRELGQQGQAVAQRRQVARACVAQGHARRDALHVGDAAPQHVRAGPRPQRDERLDRHGAPISRGGRAGDGAASGAAGGCPCRWRIRPASRTGWARLAAQGFGDFEIAARGRVQAQVLPGALRRHRNHVRECLALGLLRILEQRAAGGDGRLQVFTAVTGQACAPSWASRRLRPASKSKLQGGSRVSE